MSARAITFVTPLAILAVPALAAVTNVSLFSPANNRNISFSIYTPAEYATNPTKRYPVVYDLHGIGGTPTNRASQLAPTLDARIGAGQVQAMIFVFANGQTDSFYGDAFDGHKQVYSNIIGEVLPYIDATYRTKKQREFRAMHGFSMGGFGAMMYAAKHPELFSAVVEYGGALSKWSDLTNFNHAVAKEMYDDVEANWIDYSLWDQTTRNANALRPALRYKMIVGDADPLQQSNARFRDHLNSLNINPNYQVLPGVAHNGQAYFAEGSGLQFLNAHFARTPSPGHTAYPIVPVPEPMSLSMLTVFAPLAARRRRA